MESIKGAKPFNQPSAQASAQANAADLREVSGETPPIAVRKPNPYARKKLPDGPPAPNAQVALAPVTHASARDAPVQSTSFAAVCSEQTQPVLGTASTRQSVFFEDQAQLTEAMPRDRFARQKIPAPGGAMTAHFLVEHAGIHGAGETGPPTAASMPPANGCFPGQARMVADGYARFAPIGEGSYAHVFTAVDPDGKAVCVKVNKLESITEEFEAMRVCDSPRLCKAYSHDAQQSPHILIMELVDGIPMNDVVAKEKFQNATPMRQLTWIKNALQTLDALHAAGYTHNDISFGNILLSSTVDGAIDLKIIDFGKASALAGRARLGTAYFSSPKALNTSRPQRDAALRKENDLYALGMCVVSVFGGWDRVKIGSERYSNFINPVRMQRAHKKAMAAGERTPDIDDVAMPVHVKSIVDKMINPEIGDDAVSIIAAIDETIRRLEQW